MENPSGLENEEEEDAASLVDEFSSEDEIIYPVLVNIINKNP